MPAINEMSEGYYAEGIANYIEELKTIVLQKAAVEVTNISEIQAACEANWEGTARVNFLEEVKADAQHVSEEYNRLFNVLNQEIENASAVMQTFDSNLIK